jgi:hypothetical protein
LETQVERVVSHDRELPARQLVQRALEEAKLLLQAELLHAKQELRQDLDRAKTAGILIGVAASLGVCGLSALFVALAATLPLPFPPAVAIVGGALLIAGGAIAWVGTKRMPRNYLVQTHTRLRADVTFAWETFV